MEQQHPIPQQISSYQFKLVGDMTLKQFFQVAGGALISLLVYASSLHSFIKWPLILVFSLFGVALAFLPFEDRPLSNWILSFFRSIYSPTIYHWKKTEKLPIFFREEGATPQTTDQDEKIIAPQGEAALEAYLQTPKDQRSVFFSKLEEAEKTFLARIAGLFSPAKQAAKAIQPPQDKTPRQPPPAMPNRQPPPPPRPRLIVEETGAPIAPEELQSVVSAVSPTLAQQPRQTAQAAEFSPDAAPPALPTKPNTVSGQVMTPNGKIIEAAILEIKDSSGRPVRAVKTNKLGHFLIVTPLQEGAYEIVSEKEGFEFTDVSFEAKGDILDPIAIRAKKRVVIEEEKS